MKLMISKILIMSLNNNKNRFMELKEQIKELTLLIIHTKNNIAKGNGQK